MSLTRHDAKALLRAAGLRSTAPRVALLRLLAEAERPLSHGEVAERLGDTWDQATHYRNLVKLTDSGLVRVASEARGRLRYALPDGDGAAPHAHAHFVCDDCGTVECLPEAVVELPPVTQSGASLARAEVQVTGRCTGCAD
jgi:Fur family transcriptional regulator, ferric uptake regulator